MELEASLAKFHKKKAESVVEHEGAQVGKRADGEYFDTTKGSRPKMGLQLSSELTISGAS